MHLQVVCQVCSMPLPLQLKLGCEIHWLLHPGQPLHGWQLGQEVLLGHS